MWWCVALAFAAVGPGAAEIPDVRAAHREPLPALSAVHHPGADRSTLVVLLPGILADADALDRRGLVDALRDGGMQADLVALDAHVGYYADRSISRRVTEDVLRPARERYDQIWLVGISMGGLGALLTARDAPELVDGVLLLSPWLGRRSVVEPVRDGGGLVTWDGATPDPEAPWEHTLWAWMQGEQKGGWPSAEVHLGFGHRDLGVTNDQTLAESLDPVRVTRMEGGHSWSTWRSLAQRMVSGLDAEHPLRRVSGDAAL